MAARGQEASGQFDEGNDEAARRMMQEIHDRNHVDEQGETRALNKDIRRQEYNEKTSVTLKALFDTAKQSAENNLFEKRHQNIDGREVFKSVEANGENQSVYFNNQCIALKSGPIVYECGLSPAERSKQTLEELQPNLENESSVIDPIEGERKVDVNLPRGITATTSEMKTGMTIEGETKTENSAGK
jgi:hypothetical protein